VIPPAGAARRTFVGPQPYHDNSIEIGAALIAQAR